MNFLSYFQLHIYIINKPLLKVDKRMIKKRFCEGIEPQMDEEQQS